MVVIEILKAILFGVVEGVTEWLPVSSTGHMILLDQLVKLNVSSEFYDMFQVVIQLGAIMAVVLIFWNKLWPFRMKKKKIRGQNGSTVIKKSPAWKKGAPEMWLKIIVACIPAAIVGVLLDDKIDELFYHPVPVALALIIVGVLFIVIEIRQKDMKPGTRKISEITYKQAAIIGLFQLIAAIFPGTSRSGATIIGALLIGVSRATAAQFTFFLAVPVMCGASLLKIAKFLVEGIPMSITESLILLVGTWVAFLVSMFTINFLMGYVKKHDFKIFGVYRIVLGIVVLLFFAVIK